MNEKPGKDLARGARIKYVRTDLMQMRSQEAFAKWIGGVTRGAVGNWELGQDISLDNLVTISAKAQISLEWLAYNKGPKPTRDNRRPDASSPDDHFEMALKSFEELGAQQQRRFLQHVLGLAEPGQSQPPGGAFPAEHGKKPQ